ncbi:unnamed protein product [Rotaria socialis]|uniref:Uncharacterized protein n=3 Tax=Rotaria socialis TaxID=392032 RepID=A0A820W091_9BILA|nr:unnamed protein product [Rotaria socialis]
MDTKHNFDIFISKNFVRFSGKENVSEWLDETEKVLPIVTDNISKEEFLIPTTLTDNVMERCLDSFDDLSSEKETNGKWSSITVAFGATNTIGEIPVVEKLLMTTTDYSFVVIDQVQNDIRETTVGDPKKNSKMHKKFADWLQVLFLCSIAGMVGNLEITHELPLMIVIVARNLALLVWDL